MTLKETLFVFVLISSTAITAFSQRDVILYPTYQDYLNGEGIRHEGDFARYTHQESGKIRLRDKKTRKRLKFKCKQYWGFSYSGALFRTDPKSKKPHRVLATNKVVYYENGLGHINYIARESGGFPKGYGFCYVSESLESEMFQLPGGGILEIDLFLRGFRKLRKEKPELEPLFECMDGRYQYKKVRECVTAFTQEAIPDITLYSYKL